MKDEHYNVIWCNKLECLEKIFNPNIAFEASLGGLLYWDLNSREAPAPCFGLQRNDIFDNITHSSLFHLNSFMIKASSNVKTLLVIFTKNELP
jgi:hypothetical protein